MTLRYSGPRGKGFSGDKAKATSLQRTADLLVGSVVDRLKAPPFNGKGMLVDRRRLADGSWIRAMVNMIGNQPIMRTWIESPTKVPDLEEQLPLTVRQVEAGYLNRYDLGTPIDFGFYHQDPYASFLGYPGCDSVSDTYFVQHETRTLPQLYSKVEGAIEYVIEPKPEAFWSDPIGSVSTEAGEKLSALDSTNVNPLWHATGKYRLYQQAKLGAKLGADLGEWVPDSGLWYMDRYITTGADAGLIRAPTGTYFIAEIFGPVSEPYVQFTPLLLHEPLAQAITSAVDRKEELEAETEALAYSKLGSGVYQTRIQDGSGDWDYPVSIPDVSNPYDSPRPLMHGWKFSWDTNKARVVLLHQVRGNNTFNQVFFQRADIESMIYEMDFSWEEVVVESVPVMRFVPRVTLIESHDWRYDHAWGWWFCLAGARTTEMWTLGASPIGDAVHPDPVDAPIYGYYITDPNDPDDPMGVRNNTWADVRVTREILADGPTTYSSLCGTSQQITYAMGDDGNPVFRNWEADANKHTRYRLTFAGEALDGSDIGYKTFLRLTNISSGGSGWVDRDLPIDHPNYTPYKETFTSMQGYSSGYVLAPVSGNSLACGPVEYVPIDIPSRQSLGYAPAYGDPEYVPPLPGGPIGGPDTVQLKQSIYLFSGGFDYFSGSEIGSDTDRILSPCISMVDAESIFIVSRGFKQVSESHVRYDFAEDTWGLRLDDVWVYPPIPGDPTTPSQTPTMTGIHATGSRMIYGARQTLTDRWLRVFQQASDHVLFLGKSGWIEPIRFDYEMSSDSTPRSDEGGDCLVVTPAQYLATFRSVYENTWLYGVAFTQGVGTAKKVSTITRDWASQEEHILVPTLKSWLRQTAVAGGYPAPLADDDKTVPIGWA